ncbi:PDR/VanB family oxidoreductase [Caballeronia sp. LjRoot34]|uniref:PDR/VanB family oxidoreductase n=1 Tax=Caballeronia sp. LjRoot34 TaxID=3342325 RepID=UPI003ECC7AE6
MKVKIAKKALAANDICVLELISCDDTALPAFSAGSHIDVHLGAGLVRQYSLCNNPAERNRYVIAVLREAQSRGGSIAVHELEQGTELDIGEPRNHFPLRPDAKHSILIAGGIGITPILAMAEELNRTGESYELHYCCRSSSRAAFLDRLSQPDFQQRAHLYFDEEGPRVDLPRVLYDPTPNKHTYVCGPSGFIDAVLGAADVVGWKQGNLHREFFSAPAHSSTNDTPFHVRIASSGAIVNVAADETIVQSLRQHGIHIDTQCEQGVCGRCETRVLDGIPDHRDLYLSPEEQARNDVIMPCCSRSLTSLITLDL